MIYPKFELPDGYTSHNSGGEHLTKHLDDIPDIANIRDARGLPPIDKQVLQELMRLGGIHTIRTQGADGSQGDAIAYGIIDKSDRTQSSVLDLWTHPEHRGKGLAGYVIYKTLFQPMYRKNGPAVTASYGPQRQITCDEETIRTLQLSVQFDETDPKILNQFLSAELPESMQLIRAIATDAGWYTELIDAGTVIDYRLDARMRQPELVGWALDGLNTNIDGNV